MMNIKNINNNRIVNKYLEFQLLPNKLISVFDAFIKSKEQSIGRNLQYTTKNNYLHCISIILHHQLNSLDEYVPLGSSYWKGIFGGNYKSKVIQPLIDAEIIQYTEIGKYIPEVNEENEVHTYYRVNPEHISDEYSKKYYYSRWGYKLSKRELEDFLKEEHEYEELIFPEYEFKVDIDIKKVKIWIDLHAEEIFDERFHPEFVSDEVLGLNVPYKKWTPRGSRKEKYRTIGTIKKYAEADGLDVFFYNKRYYLADAKLFREYRIEQIKKYYTNRVYELLLKPIEDKRSIVNNRMSNQLVNFPSKLLPFVKLNNGTCIQIDIRTSQFLLFANLLNAYIQGRQEEILQYFKKDNTREYLSRLFTVLDNNKELLPPAPIDINNSLSGINSNSDIGLFIHDVFYEDFYTIVRKELGLSQRSIAKQQVFQMLFVRGTRGNALIDKLKHKYRDTIKIINEFKSMGIKQKKIKESQVNNFAVFLQCVEGEIMVDNILIPLRKAGVPCFSRHDSIVAVDHDNPQVEKKISDEFQKLGFKMNSKFDEFFWDNVDYEEFEDSGYLEWLGNENEFN